MMKMKITIRKAAPDDAPALAALWHEMAMFHAKQGPYWQIHRNSMKGYMPFIRDAAQAADKAVFVAECDGKPIGFILAQLANRARIFVQREHGLIVDLAVTRAFRRTGIGGQLVQRAVRWFKTKKVTRLEVRISTANPLATAFWRKMGFEPYMAMSKREI